MSTLYLYTCNIGKYSSSFSVTPPALLYFVSSFNHVLQQVEVAGTIVKDPVLPIVHCTLRFLGSHFCDVENSEAFVCGENRTL